MMKEKHHVAGFRTPEVAQKVADKWQASGMRVEQSKKGEFYFVEAWEGLDKKPKGR